MESCGHGCNALCTDRAIFVSNSDIHILCIQPFCTNHSDLTLYSLPDVRLDLGKPPPPRERPQPEFLHGANPLTAVLSLHVGQGDLASVIGVVAGVGDAALKVRSAAKKTLKLVKDTYDTLKMSLNVLHTHDNCQDPTSS